jgi:glycosyltransferase involved in cell wall biosynthesis
MRIFFIVLLCCHFMSCIRKSEDEPTRVETPRHHGQPSPEHDADCIDQDKTPTLQHLSHPRIGIVVTVFNRPEYLRPMLESLKFSELDESVWVVLVNDASTDQSTLNIIKNYQIPSIKKDVIKINFEKNQGLVVALMAGMDTLKDSVDYLTNLDPDTMVKKNWLSVMHETFEAIDDPKIILTGFNAPAHAITGSCEYIHDGPHTFCEKKSMGGINFFFTSQFYKKNMVPWLHEINSKTGWRVWDNEVNRCMLKNNLKSYATSPSMVQHIGARGTNSLYDGLFDFAEDF